MFKKNIHIAFVSACIILPFPSIALYVVGLQKANFLLYPLAIVLSNSVSTKVVASTLFVFIYGLVVILYRGDFTFMIEAIFWFSLSIILFEFAKKRCDVFRLVEKVMLFISGASVLSFFFMFFNSGGFATFETPNGREYEFAMSFAIENIWTKAFPIFRQAGIFEEPGIFASLLAAIVVGKVIRSDKIDYRFGVLVVGILVTFSLFAVVSVTSFIVMWSLSRQLRSFQTMKLADIKILMFFGLMFAALYLFVPEIYKYISGRIFSFIEGDSYGNTRAHLSAFVLENFSMRDFLIGVQNLHLLDNPSFGTAHILSHLVIYGSGFLILFAITQYKIILRPSGILPFLFMCLFIYQRPDFFLPINFLVLSSFWRPQS